MERAIIGPVVQAVRPNFLSLTPVCVLLGIGAASRTSGHVSMIDCLLVLIGALLAHASVNLLNEYDDFRSGLDFLTIRTPFSGGSGSLPAHPEAAAAAGAWGLLCLALMALIGLYFAYERGVALLPIGLAGLLLVVAYTPFVTRHALLCLLAPGLGFGPLMVMGTAFALSGEYSWIAFAASVPPLCFVSGLLLLNQFPDVDADRKVGRRNLPVVLGRQWSAVLFAALVVGAFAALTIAVAARALPVWTLLGLLTLPMGVLLARRVHAHADDLPKLVVDMGLNVAFIHASLLLIAIGLFVR
ncbi:MAG: prenyltransferase [Rhodanobacteraceae bacterium]